MEHVESLNLENGRTNKGSASRLARSEIFQVCVSEFSELWSLAHLLYLTTYYTPYTSSECLSYLTIVSSGVPESDARAGEPFVRRGEGKGGRLPGDEEDALQQDCRTGAGRVAGEAEGAALCLVQARRFCLGVGLVAERCSPLRTENIPFRCFSILQFIM